MPFPIVGIGASAGGLEAFTQLLKHLPPDTGMGFVLVQHLDPDHESALTQILSRATPLPVREMTDNQPVEPNHVYVIPPDTNLSIVRGMLKLEPRQRTRTPHRPIDRLLRIAGAGPARAGHRRRAVRHGQRRHAGAGGDQGRGRHHLRPGRFGQVRLDAAKRGGGRMRGSRALAGGHREGARRASPSTPTSPDERRSPLFDARETDRATATPQDTARRALGRHGTSPADARRRAPKPGATPTTARRRRAATRRFLLLLRNHSGVDFSLYKSTTIQRRIARRMVLNRQDTLADYAGFLRGQRQGARRALLRRAHQRDELLPQPRGVRRPPAQGLPQAPSAARRRSAARLGARLLDRPGGLFHRHGVHGDRGEGAAHAQAPGVRHRPQRCFARKGAPGALRQEPRAGHLAGTAAAVLRRGGRRLPRQQGAARNGGLRPAEPHQPIRRSRAWTSSAAATS